MYICHFPDTTWKELSNLAGSSKQTVLTCSDKLSKWVLIIILRLVQLIFIIVNHASFWTMGGPTHLGWFYRQRRFLFVCSPLNVNKRSRNPLQAFLFFKALTKTCPGPSLIGRGSKKGSGLKWNSDERRSRRNTCSPRLLSFSATARWKNSCPWNVGKRTLGCTTERRRGSYNFRL